MNIYHGSKVITAYPYPKGSNPKNDYGPAFYLTLDLEAAKTWACRNDTVGVVNKYFIDNRSFNSLKILDLTDKTHYSILNWLAILMHFRQLDNSFKTRNERVLDWLEKYYIDVDQYDVVIGFRADDAYFRFPILFLENNFPYEELENVYLSGNLGIQYAFISKKAIGLLHFEEAIECDESFKGRYYSIIREASEHFNKMLSIPRDETKTYALDLMRKDNDLR